MRILVTGASGFVGRNLLPQLLLAKHEVAILVRKEFDNSSLTLKKISTSDKDWKLEIIRFQPEVVIHLASFLTSDDRELVINNLIESNITYGTHLLDALKDVEITHFINVGTFAEYYNGNVNPEPAYLYAATKTAFKSILRYYQSIGNFKIVHVVPYSIYGTVDSQKKVIDHIYDATFKGVVKQMSPGEQRLDFIHINDVVGFFVSLLVHLDSVKMNYSEIHLGTGKGTSLREVAALFKEITGRTPAIEWGALPYRKRDTMYSVAERNLPSEYFPWQAGISLDTGLRIYLENIKHHELSES